MRRIDLIRQINWFIQQMKAENHPNATTLSKRFGINRQSAQNALTVMREHYHVPMKYDPATRGYRLDRQFDLPSFWIDDDELLLLAMTRNVLNDLEDRKAWERLFKKMSLLSLNRIAALQKRIHFKGTGSYRSRPGILGRLIDAILDGRECDMTYQPVYRPLTPFTVRICPLCLVYYRNNWYLIALYEEKPRTYALARIESVAIGETVPDHSPLIERIREIIDQPFGIFTTDDDDRPQEIRLRFSPDIAPFIRTVCFHPGQELETTTDGGLILRFPSFINPELIGEILRYGPEVRVLEPAVLKDKVVEALRKNLENYPDSGFGTRD